MERAVKSAFILGGTRGIGRAFADLLLFKGNWEVEAPGRLLFNVHSFPKPQKSYDLFIFSAGDLWETWRGAFDYPMTFYRLVAVQSILNEGGQAIALSSVSAKSGGRVNPHYAAAKAALENYVKSIKLSDDYAYQKWLVDYIEFDLVETQMMAQLPKNTILNRTVITPEYAAELILEYVQ